MRIAEIRQLSIDDLVKRERDLKDDLFRLKFQLASGQLTDYRRIREVRREIARVMTVRREKELGLNR